MALVSVYLVLLGVALSTVPQDAKQPVQNGNLVLPDKSLTPDEYTKLGMPALNAPWGAKEYEAAIATLDKLKTTPEKLPRHQSATSGKVFAKLIDGERFDEILRPGQKIERVLEVVPCLASLGRAIRIYSSAAWPKHSLMTEVVELQVPVLRALAKILPLVNQFETTLDKNDAKYPVRARGLKQLYTSLNTLVTSSFVIFSDRVHGTSVNRKRLAEIYDSYLPGIIKALPSEHRNDLTGRFSRMAESEADLDVKSVLEKIAKRLHDKSD